MPREILSIGDTGAEFVRKFNSNIKSFPSNLIANLFGFKEKEYFISDEGADIAPKVSFE